MNDDKIVDLYWIRSEDAITETSIKYGKYCYGIAYNILADAEDAEESVNDTYFDAWNTMPPHRPSALSAFLGKLTRRISIDRWRKRSAFPPMKTLNRMSLPLIWKRGSTHLSTIYPPQSGVCFSAGTGIWILFPRYASSLAILKVK